MQLGGADYNHKMKSGDSVSCHMKKKEPKDYIDTEITVKGKFGWADFLRNGLVIVLENYEIQTK